MSDFPTKPRRYTRTLAKQQAWDAAIQAQSKRIDALYNDARDQLAVLLRDTHASRTLQHNGETLLQTGDVYTRDVLDRVPPAMLPCVPITDSDLRRQALDIVAAAAQAESRMKTRCCPVCRRAWKRKRLGAWG